MCSPDNSTIMMINKTLDNFFGQGNHDSISQLNELFIEVAPTYVNVKFCCERVNVSIYYRKTEEGCRIECHNEEKILLDQNYLDVAFLELFSILKDHDRTIPKMYLHFDKLTSSQFVEESLKILKPHLKSRPRQFQVEHFLMDIDEQEEVLELLPLLDSNVLKHIFLVNRSENRKILETGELIKLDQWKNAEEIDIKGFMIKGSDLQSVSKIHSISR